MGFAVDDLDVSVDRLTKLGAKFGEVFEDEGRRSVYLYDPDGHEIELVEY